MTLPHIYLTLFQRSGYRGAQFVRTQQVSEQLFTENKILALRTHLGYVDLD